MFRNSHIYQFMQELETSLCNEKWLSEQIYSLYYKDKVSLDSFYIFWRTYKTMRHLYLIMLNDCTKIAKKISFRWNTSLERSTIVLPTLLSLNTNLIVKILLFAPTSVEKNKRQNFWKVLSNDFLNTTNNNTVASIENDRMAWYRECH